MLTFVEGSPLSARLVSLEEWFHVSAAESNLQICSNLVCFSHSETATLSALPVASEVSILRF